MFLSEAATGGVLLKGVPKHFANFTQKQVCQSLFLNKVAGLRPGNSAQVFSCQFCEIFKNTFFTEHLRATACFFYKWHLHRFFKIPSLFEKHQLLFNFLFLLQSVTKIVRLVPPPPLFNVGCKFACSFLVLTAWHGFFRLGTTLSQGEGGILGNFK